MTFNSPQFLTANHYLNFTRTSQCFSRLYAASNPSHVCCHEAGCQGCRDAKWTDHSPAIRYILMETISAAVPWGRPLNNACESSGSQWPEAYPPLLLPLMAYPVRVTGQHVACWTVLHTAQTTTDRFWFQKQSRAMKVITGFYKELLEKT